MNFHDPIPDEGVDAIVPRRLEESGDFRVLRRLTERDIYNMAAPGEPTRTGVLVDLETTGLDTATAECIELGMVKFSYTSSNDRVVRVLDTFDLFHEPSVPITPEITKITGITTEMVAGHRIDPAAVAAFLSGTVGVANRAQFRIRPSHSREILAGIPASRMGLHCPRTRLVGSRISRCPAGIPSRASASFTGRTAPSTIAEPFWNFSPSSRKREGRCCRFCCRRPGGLQSGFGPRLHSRPRTDLRAAGTGGIRATTAGPAPGTSISTQTSARPELKFLRDEIYCGRDVEPLVREVTAFTRFSNRI